MLGKIQETIRSVYWDLNVTQEHLKHIIV